MNPSPPNLPLFGCTDIMAYTQITHNPAATQNRLIEVVISFRKEDSTKNTSQSLIVYPNPNTGRFYLNINNSGSEENAQIEVFDLLSRNIFSENILLSGDVVTEIELPADTPEGIYMLKVKGLRINNFVKLIITKP